VVARQSILEYKCAAIIHAGDFEVILYVDIQWLDTVKTNHGIDILRSVVLSFRVVHFPLCCSSFTLC